MGKAVPKCRPIDKNRGQAYHLPMRHSLYLPVFLILSTIACLSVQRPAGFQSIAEKTIPITATVRVNVTINSLQELETVRSPETLPPEGVQKQVREILNRVQKQIRESFSLPLSEQNKITVRWVNESDFNASSEPYRLEITLSGYGRLKKKWIRYMLASGVVEALFQGIVVASALNNTWAGIAVGAEEMTSEWITWHGGAWLFARTFAPITLEGHLWRTRDGKLVWRKTVFVSKNKKELEKLPESKQNRREVRLSANLHKAESLLLKDLLRYLKKQAQSLPPDRGTIQGTQNKSIN